MARYMIKSYKKLDQSFLSTINSIDAATGVIPEPYEITLERFTFFGLFSSTVIKKVQFPKGFNHTIELTEGREWIEV